MFYNHINYIFTTLLVMDFGFSSHLVTLIDTKFPPGKWEFGIRKAEGGSLPGRAKRRRGGIRKARLMQPGKHLGVGCSPCKH